MALDCLCFGKSFIVERYVKTYTTWKRFTRECQKTNLNLKPKTTTKQIALIVVFSAIYAAMRIIPTFPVIGTGGYFSVADILAPIYGIILGPYLGGASVIIGTFIGMSAKAPIFLGLDFLPGFINAVALGFLVRRKWLPVVILNAVLLFAFVLSPLTLNFVNIPIGNSNLSIPFTWLHITAFIVLISPLGMKAGKWIQTEKTEISYKKSHFSFIRRIWSKRIVGFATLAFVGTMMQHLTGNILFENIFVNVTHVFTPETIMGYWFTIFFVYPWERLTLVILATLIGLPLFYVLTKTRLIQISNAKAMEEDKPLTTFS